MTDYRVQLDIYNGPLDLLLYLIRREEVDIYDIPIARITEQYVTYVELLRQLDPNAVGEFLVMAATLMEIKSRMLLPRQEAEEGEEELVDPRLELVRQLLEYKQFKDAAFELGAAAQAQASRFARPHAELGETPSEVDLQDVQIWDLFAAFNQLMVAIGRTPTAHEVVYDDTPVLLHAADLLDRLEREGGSLAFERVFEGRTRAEMIGLFLALLELIRQQRVRAQQQVVFGTIVLFLLDPTPISKLTEAERPEPDVTDVSGAAESPAAPLEDDLDEEDAEIRSIDESIGQVSVDPSLEPDRTPRNKGDDSSAAEG